MPDIPELPNRLVPDANLARVLVDNACEAHYEYHKLIDKQQRHLDGETPFDKQKLIASGQDWRRNRPHLKAKAMVDRVATDRVTSAMSALTNASVSFNRFDPDNEKHADQNKQWMRLRDQRNRYGIDISRVYVEALERDRRFFDYLTSISYSSATWGVGYVVKEPGKETKDWLGAFYDIRNVKLPKRSSPENLEKFVTFEKQNALFFYKTWKRTKDNVNSSWNRDGLEELLKALFNHGKDGNQTKESWGDIAPSFAQTIPDLIEQRHGEVRFSKIFNEEVDGSLTVTYFAYSGNHKNTDLNRGDILPAPKHFLYQRNFENKDVADVLFYVRDSAISSSGCLQDLRGLAQYAVPDSHDYDVRRNSLKDKEMVFGNIQLQADTGNMHQKSDLAITSVSTTFPVGWRPIERQQSVDIGPLIQSMRDEEIDFRRETQAFDANASGRIGNRATRQEVQTVTQEVQSAKRSKQIIQLNDWTRLHESNLRDLIFTNFQSRDKMGRESRDWFMSELQFLWEFDTEEEVMAVVEEFRAMEVDFAIDDPEILASSLERIDNDVLRRETERALFFSLGFPRRQIESAIPRLDQGGITTDQHQLAEIQNNMFWNRGDILISRSNQIDTHLNEHYRLFQQVIDSVQRGADPARASKYLTNGTAHTAKLLLLAERDPLFDEEQVQAWTNQQRQFEADLESVNQIAQQEAQRLADEREQQSQPQPDVATVAKIQRDNMESQAKQRRTEDNQEFTRQQKEERELADQDRKERKFQADEARKNAQFLRDQQRDQNG